MFTTAFFATLITGFGGGWLSKWAHGALKTRGNQLKGLVPAAHVAQAADAINGMVQPAIDAISAGVAQKVSASLVPHVTLIANSADAISAAADKLTAAAAVSGMPVNPSR